MHTEHGTVEIDKTSVTPGENVTLTFYPEYKEGTIEVYANGENLTELVFGNTFICTPTADIEFDVRLLWIVPREKAVISRSCYLFPWLITNLCRT